MGRKPKADSVAKKSKTIQKHQKSEDIHVPEDVVGEIRTKVTKKSRILQKHRKPKNIQVPEEVLAETLNVINQDFVRGKVLMEERRCSVLIHNISPNIRHNYKNISFKLLEEARLCVLQRDWINLAKILAIAKPGSKRDHVLFFQIFVRYAAICLAHNPNAKLMNLFMQGVASCSNDLEKQKFLNSLTNG